MIDRAPDAAVVADAGGRVTYWNARAAGLFGWSPAEAVGRTVAGLIVPPEYREAHEEGLAEAARAGPGAEACLSLELEALHRDGRRIPIELSISCLREAEEAPHFGLFARDVSRQRAGEREARVMRRALLASEQRLAEAQQVTKLGSFEWDLDSGEIRWSDRLNAMFGLERATAPVRLAEHVALADREDRGGLNDALAQARRQGAAEGEYRAVRADGAACWIHGRYRLLPGRRVAGTLQDVTDRRAADEALREAEEGFRQSFDHAPIGIGLVATTGLVLRVNRALCELTGYPEDRLVGTHVRDLIDSDDLETDLGHVRHLLAGRSQSVQADRRCRHAAGHAVSVQVSGSLVRDPGGRPRHFIAQVLDIGARKDHERRLLEMARRDELTELLNRRGFEEELRRQLAHVQRHGRVAALLMIDLDDFKAINDAHGHKVGDGVLRAVAAAMRERLRRTDVAARLGGDEFAILLPEAALGQARRVAAELAMVISEGARAELPGSPRLAASIGVTALDHTLGVAELLHKADRDMYAAKRGGGGEPRFQSHEDTRRNDR